MSEEALAAIDAIEAQHQRPEKPAVDETSIDTEEAQQQHPEKRPTIRNNPAITPNPGIGKSPRKALSNDETLTQYNARVQNSYLPVIQFINDADNDILVDDEFLKNVINNIQAGFNYFVDE